MSIRIGCSDVVNGLNKSNSGTDISRTSTAEAMEAEDAATVSSTISSDTEDEVNSSTEAKGAIAGLGPASGSSTLCAKDLSSAGDSGLSSSISSTDSESTRSQKNEV